MSEKLLKHSFARDLLPVDRLRRRDGCRLVPLITFEEHTDQMHSVDEHRPFEVSLSLAFLARNQELVQIGDQVVIAGIAGLDRPARQTLSKHVGAGFTSRHIS